MRKFIFLSATLITAMTALSSCGKTTPSEPGVSKEQVIGNWHYLSGDFMDLYSVTPEKTYHFDLSLKGSGTGTVSAWYEADSESIASKTSNIGWKLENGKLVLTIAEKEQTYDVSVGDSGNLVLALSELEITEFRKDQLSNLKTELLNYSWYSPLDSKFRQKVSYNLAFNNSTVSILTYNKELNRYTKRDYVYELTDKSLIIWGNSNKSRKLYEWQIKFINNSYIGLGDMILRN